MEKKADTINEENIEQLINQFYQKVRKDSQLKPVFEKAIGKTDEDWAPHLQKMYDFWSAVMLGTRRYHGNPMEKHREILPFDSGLFEIWLQKFEETAKEVYQDHLSILYIDRSQRIARNLKSVLFKTHWQ